MLPKENRLNIRTYYREIRGTGKKIYDPLFSLYYRNANNGHPPKINIIISKKIAKAATARNRMRRLIHASIEELLKNIKPGVEGLFFVHQDYSHENSQTIKNKIQKILIAGGLYEETTLSTNP